MTQRARSCEKRSIHARRQRPSPGLPDRSRSSLNTVTRSALRLTQSSLEHVSAKPKRQERKYGCSPIKRLNLLLRAGNQADPGQQNRHEHGEK